MRNFFLFFILIFTIQSAAQDNFEDKTYKENIRTVLMFVEGDELSFPVLDLQSDKKMVLLFDDLDADIKDYYYTIIHCNADWNPSDLDPS